MKKIAMLVMAIVVTFVGAVNAQTQKEIRKERRQVEKMTTKELNSKATKAAQHVKRLNA